MKQPSVRQAGRRMRAAGRRPRCGAAVALGALALGGCGETADGEPGPGGGSDAGIDASVGGVGAGTAASGGAGAGPVGGSGGASTGGSDAGAPPATIEVPGWVGAVLQQFRTHVWDGDAWCYSSPDGCDPASGNYLNTSGQCCKSPDFDYLLHWDECVANDGRVWGFHPTVAPNLTDVLTMSYDDVHRLDEKDDRSDIIVAISKVGGEKRVKIVHKGAYHKAAATDGGTVYLNSNSGGAGYSVPSSEGQVNVAQETYYAGPIQGPDGTPTGVVTVPAPVGELDVPDEVQARMARLSFRIWDDPDGTPFDRVARKAESYSRAISYDDFSTHHDIEHIYTLGMDDHRTADTMDDFADIIVRVWWRGDMGIWVGAVQLTGSYRKQVFYNSVAKYTYVPDSTSSYVKQYPVLIVHLGS